jgi:hypothetical protein
LRGYRNSYWRAAYVAQGGYLKLLHRALYSPLGMSLILKRSALFRMLRRRAAPRARPSE